MPATSSIHTATLKPNVAGTACWPWVRPGSSMSLVRSARSAMARRMDASCAQEDIMGATQEEELTGLRDVLRRGTPVHVAAGVAVAHAVQLPDQRHERMAGARQAGMDVVQI